MKIKRFYSSFILLLIGGLFAKMQIIIGDGCEGMPEVFMSIFLFFLFILVLIIVLAISLFKYLKKKVPFNYFPLLTTLIIVIVNFGIIQSKKFESSTIIFATADMGRHDLTLRENNTFKIRMAGMDWSCYYKGKFRINKDTLFLSRNDIQSKTDSIFADKYLIDKSKKMMYPIDRLNYLQDTARWLTIVDYEN